MRETTTQAAFCPRCDQRCRTHSDRPWLPTVCIECGGNVPDG